MLYEVITHRKSSTDDFTHLDLFSDHDWGLIIYDEAIEHWRRVLEITPDNASAYTNLGAAFAESGRLAEAQTMYERALAIIV